MMRIYIFLLIGYGAFVKGQGPGTGADLIDHGHPHGDPRGLNLESFRRGAGAIDLSSDPALGDVTAGDSGAGSLNTLVAPDSLTGAGGSTTDTGTETQPGFVSGQATMAAASSGVGGLTRGRLTSATVNTMPSLSSSDTFQRRTGAQMGMGTMTGPGAHVYPAGSGSTGASSDLRLDGAGMRMVQGGAPGFGGMPLSGSARSTITSGRVRTVPTSRGPMVLPAGGGMLGGSVGPFLDETGRHIPEPGSMGHAGGRNGGMVSPSGGVSTLGAGFTPPGSRMTAGMSAAGMTAPGMTPSGMSAVGMTPNGLSGGTTDRRGLGPVFAPGVAPGGFSTGLPVGMPGTGFTGGSGGFFPFGGMPVPGASLGGMPGMTMPGPVLPGASLVGAPAGMVPMPGAAMGSGGIGAFGGAAYPTVFPAGGTSMGMTGGVAGGAGGVIPGGSGMFSVGGGTASAMSSGLNGAAPLAGGTVGMLNGGGMPGSGGSVSLGGGSASAISSGLNGAAPLDATSMQQGIGTSGSGDASGFGGTSGAGVTGVSAGGSGMVSAGDMRGSGGLVFERRGPGVPSFSAPGTFLPLSSYGYMPFSGPVMMPFTTGGLGYPIRPGMPMFAGLPGGMRPPFFPTYPFGPFF